MSILDVGCGEGRFCRMLAERGAVVTGIDLTPALVEEAHGVHAAGSYLTGSAEILPVAAGLFDVVVSYIVLVDVVDFRAAIREMARVVKPGGRIVVANLSSFATTSATGWHRDGDGKKLHFPVDRYFEERALRLSWSGISVINWHRPMEAYMSAYLDAGLILQKFVEPVPSTAALAERPKMVDSTRIAFFNIMVWQKPFDLGGVA